MEDINSTDVTSQILGNQLTETPVVKQKNVFKILFFISIFVLLIVVVVFCLIIQNNKNQKVEVVKNNAVETITTIPTEAISQSITQTPTNDITVNWKTFSNNDWGISFKYPSTYVIVKNTIQKPSTIDAGELILEDQTRDGKPKIQLLFNPDGMGGNCMVGHNDFFYEAKILNNKINISNKEQNLDPAIPDCDDNLTMDILFDIRGYSGSDQKNSIHGLFSYATGDYQSELDKIIETMVISKPDIY